MSRWPAVFVIAALIGGCANDVPTTTVPTQLLAANAGDHQTGFVRIALTTSLRVQLTDAKTGEPVSGVVITWSTTAAGAAVSPAQSTTDATGLATAVATLGTAAGAQQFHASAPSGAAADFTATATVPAGALLFSPRSLTVCAGIQHPHDLLLFATDSAGRTVSGVTAAIAGGDATDNVPSSAVATDYTPVPFTMDTRIGAHILHATAPGYLPDSIVVMVASPCPVSARALFYVRDMATANYVNVGDSGQVTAIITNDSGGVTGRTVTARVISGGVAVSPASYTTRVGGYADFNLTTSAAGEGKVEVSSGGATDTVTVHVLPGSFSLVTTVAHPGGSTNSQDTYVRDGLAFFSGLNNGIVIYDVGNGTYGGSPASPTLASQIMPNSDGFAFGGAPVRSWWFHNPVRGENRYLFVSQSGSAGGVITGDIHVIDVSDLAHPVEVGFIHQASGGPRGLWVDEANQVLYAAYHGGGVLKIDVSGALSGDLSSRILASAQPGGAGHTDGWDVTLANGTLYYVDHASGFWALDPATLATKGGGNNGPPFGSETLLTLNGIAINGSTAYVGLDQCDVGDWEIYALGGNGVPSASSFRGNPGYPCFIGQLALTPDRRLLGIATERGLSLYDMANPSAPQLRAIYPTLDGFCSVEFAVINGRTYAFLSTNDAAQGIAILDVTNALP